MRALRAEVASRHERLRAKLVLNIEGPALHVRCLIIRVYASDGWNRQADNWISGERIVEGSRINDCLCLKRRIGTDQPRLVETERHLIIVHAVTGSDRSRPFLKWVPSDSHSRRKVVASRRDRLAKR